MPKPNLLAGDYDVASIGQIGETAYNQYFDMLL